MTTRINVADWIISTISIQIKTERIRLFSSERVTADKSTSSRIVISSSKINRTRFSIKIFATVTEYIRVTVGDILLNTESIISVRLYNIAISVGNIYNITMSVLSVESVITLTAFIPIKCSRKTCTSNVNSRCIVSCIIYNDLTANPNMCCCNTIYCLAIS